MKMSAIMPVLIVKNYRHCSMPIPVPRPVRVLAGRPASIPSAGKKFECPNLSVSSRPLDQDVVVVEINECVLEDFKPLLETNPARKTTLLPHKV